MRTAQEIAEIIENLIKKRKMAINKFLIECGLSERVVSNMKAGSMPSSDKIAIMANYLEVSTDYLLTGQEPQPKELAPDQQELLSLWEQLDYEKKIEFKGELKGYIRAKAEDANKKGVTNADFVEKNRGDSEFSEDFGRRRA